MKEVLKGYKCSQTIGKGRRESIEKNARVPLHPEGFHQEMRIVGKEEGRGSGGEKKKIGAGCPWTASSETCFGQNADEQ